MLDQKMVLIIGAIWIVAFFLALTKKPLLKIFLKNLVVTFAYIGLVLLIFGIEGRESLYTHIILLTILGLHSILLSGYMLILIFRK